MIPKDSNRKKTRHIALKDSDQAIFTVCVFSFVFICFVGLRCDVCVYYLFFALISTLYEIGSIHWMRAFHSKFLKFILFISLCLCFKRRPSTALFRLASSFFSAAIKISQ